VRIFRTKVCSKPNSKQRKAAQKTFYKKCACPSISSTFYACFFWYKSGFAQLFSSYVLAKKALLSKKCAHKMLMKLTPDLIISQGL